jgi:hypothetical protein
MVSGYKERAFVLIVRFAAGTLSSSLSSLLMNFGGSFSSAAETFHVECCKLMERRALCGEINVAITGSSNSLDG